MITTPCSPRRRGQGLAGGAGNRLGLVESGVVLALAGILPGEQFLQADQIGPGRGRLGDPRERLLHVRRLRGVPRHLNQGHDGAARRRRMLRFDLVGLNS